MQGDLPPFSIDNPPENIVKVSLRGRTKLMMIAPGVDDVAMSKGEKNRKIKSFMALDCHRVTSVENIFSMPASLSR